MKVIKAPLREVKKDWEILLDNAISKNIYVSIPWLLHLDLHDDVNEHPSVIIFYDSNIPIAGFPIILPRFKGDLSDILLNKNFALGSNFYVLILNEIRKYYNDYYPEGAFLKYNSFLVKDSKFWKDKIVTRKQKMNWSIELPKTFDEYMKQFKSKERYNLRRSKKILEETHKVEIETKCDISELKSFAYLHAMRWGPRWSSLSMQMLLKRFAEDLGEDFWLSKLSVDDKVEYMIFCAQYNNVLYSLLVGSTGEYNKYSLGIMLYIAIIQEAIERRIGEFDLLKGNTPYKHYLGAKGRPHYLIDLKR
jgi:hypothetical protein